jgi:hypothetical protein
MKCSMHKREDCPNGFCQRLAARRSTETASSTASSSSSDNAGQLGIDNQGDLTIGLGGGLGIDTSDGSITFGSGGFSIDSDGQ